MHLEVLATSIEVAPRESQQSGARSRAEEAINCHGHGTAFSGKRVGSGQRNCGDVTDNLCVVVWQKEVQYTRSC